jgi:hypothetical protein
MCENLCNVRSNEIKRHFNWYQLIIYRNTSLQLIIYRNTSFSLSLSPSLSLPPSLPLIKLVSYYVAFYSCRRSQFLHPKVPHRTPAGSNLDGSHKTLSKKTTAPFQTLRLCSPLFMKKQTNKQKVHPLHISFPRSQPPPPSRKQPPPPTPSFGWLRSFSRLCRRKEAWGTQSICGGFSKSSLFYRLSY